MYSQIGLDKGKFSNKLTIVCDFNHSCRIAYHVFVRDTLLVSMTSNSSHMQACVLLSAVLLDYYFNGSFVTLDVRTFTSSYA